MRVWYHHQSRRRVARDLEDHLALDVTQLLDDDIRIDDRLLVNAEDDIADEQTRTMGGEAGLQLEHDDAVLALAAVGEGHPEACWQRERVRVSAWKARVQ